MTNEPCPDCPAVYTGHQLQHRDQRRFLVAFECVEHGRVWNRLVFGDDLKEIRREDALCSPQRISSS